MLYNKEAIDYRGEFYVVSKEEDSALRDLYKVMSLIIINAPTKEKCIKAFYKHCKSEGIIPRNIIKKDKPIITLYNQLCEYHKPISKYFSSGEGIKLQYQDSQIMESILLSCMKQNIPVLPVHDSVICPISNKDIVYDIMREEYKKRLGFYPVIK